jgi:pyrimidine-nucleoside phosphorylase
MFPQDIIRKKRDKQALSKDEISAFIEGLGTGDFKDYQASALLMAIFLNGMNARETAWLTEAMMRSGVVIELDRVRKPKVDKHSTGGVGDKISLILGPLAAASGICVPMISGRGLGHSGGTLDKLESIPGFRVDLSIPAYRRQLAAIDQALVGQTASLAPADRILYALRDVTATVECIPLICASIMSKKLVEGIDSLVLDVKYGSGAFMETVEDALNLGRSLVAIGKEMGKGVVAVLTNMDQPLGRKVGNALEVEEAIECLRGEGPADVMEVTYTLCTEMLLLAGLAETGEEARTVLEKHIATGAALERFRQVIRAQGGDSAVVDDTGRLPRAAFEKDIFFSPEDEGLEGGTFYVAGINARKIAVAAMILGAGRESVDAIIDPAVGVSGLLKVGEPVAAGDALCRLHYNPDERLAEAEREVREAFSFSQKKVDPAPLIGEKIR